MSILLSSTLLLGCDSQYKDKIQKNYGHNNPQGNKAICIAAGDVRQNYTIKYMDVDK